MLRLLAFAAAASAFADGLKVGSTTNYTLGGWISASASGTASLNASRIGIRSLPPITCGFLVGHRPSAPYGDSWAKLQDGSSYASRVQSLPAGQSLAVPSSELQGPAIWLLRDLLGQFNATVSFKAVRLPAGRVFPNSIDESLGLKYVLDDMGLDCVARLVPFTSDDMGSFSFTVPILSANYVVIGRRPAPPDVVVRDHIKYAFIPFTGYTWLLVGGILLTSATTMATFEWGKKEANGGPWRPERSFFKHGLGFLGIAAVTMTGHGFFDEPASAGGRSYAAMKAFCVVILWGVFIGNMTAFLVVLPKYVETITGIMDFAISGGTGTPACLLNNTDVQNYMANAQMYTPTLVLQTQDPFDVVGAVSGGDCDGAVVYDVELAEGGTNNPNTQFCNVEMKGPLLTSTTYAMPFSQRLGLGSFGRAVPGQKPDPAWWVSLNKLILYSLETSQFQLQGYGTFFDPQPPACVPAMTAGQDLRELSFLRLTELDLSGIFILQCGGIALALIAACLTTAPVAKKMGRRLSTGGGGQQKIGAILAD